MKKKKSKKIIILLVVVVLVIGGLWACGNATANNVVNVVEVTKPEKGEIEEIVSVGGVVQTEELKVYFSPVNGEILDVSVEAGDVVKAGDVLITYDTEAMADTLEQARLQYLSGNTSYNNTLSDGTDAQQKLAEANRNLTVLEEQIAAQKAYVKAMHEQLESVQTERSDVYEEKSLELQKLMIELQKDPIKNSNAIAQVQMDMQELQHNASKVNRTEDLKAYEDSIEAEEEKLADLQEQKAEMEAQKQSAEMGTLSDFQKENLSVTEQLNLLNYENAQEAYDLATQGIVAAFDGIVTEVSVMDDMPVGESTQLLSLANNNAVMVKFSVGKYDLERIAEGMVADIEISGNNYSGTITKINKMAQTTNSGSTQVGAEIHIDNPDDKIYLGLDAKVKIHANKATDAILIPINALNADKDGDFVYVEENGVAVRKNVVTGISTTEMIEIKEGLTIEDKVITTSILPLEDGMAVMNQSDLMAQTQTEAE